MHMHDGAQALLISSYRGPSPGPRWCRPFVWYRFRYMLHLTKHQSLRSESNTRTHITTSFVMNGNVVDLTTPSPVRKPPKRPMSVLELIDDGSTNSRNERSEVSDTSETSLCIEGESRSSLASNDSKISEFLPMNHPRSPKVNLEVESRMSMRRDSIYQGYWSDH